MNTENNATIDQTDAEATEPNIDQPGTCSECDTSSTSRLKHYSARLDLMIDLARALQSPDGYALAQHDGSWKNPAIWFDHHLGRYHAGQLSSTVGGMPDEYGYTFGDELWLIIRECVDAWHPLWQDKSSATFDELLKGALVNYGMTLPTLPILGGEAAAAFDLTVPEFPTKHNDD